MLATNLHLSVRLTGYLPHQVAVQQNPARTSRQGTPRGSSDAHCLILLLLLPCVWLCPQVESGAMIAAGAVVEAGSTVASGELWAGNPARRVRELKQEEKDYLETLPDRWGQTRLLAGRLRWKGMGFGGRDGSCVPTRCHAEAVPCVCGGVLECSAQQHQHEQ